MNQGRQAVPCHIRSPIPQRGIALVPTQPPDQNPIPRESMEIPAKQLAEMHAILDREAGESPFSDSQRRWFRRLDWFGYGWLVLSTVVGLPGAIALLTNGGTDFSHVVRFFIVMTLWFSPCSIATYVLMFLLNWKPIFATLRREKEVWKLGYGEMLTAPWRAERAKHRVLNTLTLLAGPFVLGCGLFFGVVEIFSDALIPEPGWPHPSWWVYLCSSYVSGIGVLYVFLHFFRRADERLGVIKKLKESLVVASGGDSTPDSDIGVASVSAVVRDQIAQIERKQIWEHRAASISNFDVDSDIAFAVQKSRAVRDAEAALDPSTCLRVQDEIVSLSQSSEKAVIGEGVDGIRWWPVPETSLQLGYSVEPAARRIRIMELRDVAGQEGDLP